ncbi:GAF and ANTAR domain-containing protein [Streptomyces ochraceiscleroticus]|uniref:GAF and ANTAR domain-containing protein n=1 Tax=Streptomyces ochraceiscleroticus TaxID=47761 RepID=A0ABW1MI76_9ACTN|nr:GAF and ANTAR domain-containing protein [Streptomyces ochraceiscleroticus]
MCDETTHQPSVHQQLTPLLLDLADTAPRDLDNGGVLRRLTDHSQKLPGVEATAVISVDERTKNTPTVAAASDHASGQLAQAQLEFDEGPGLEALRTGRRLADLPLDRPSFRSRWPRFVPRSLSEGFTGITVIPLRHQHRAIAALHLHHQHCPHHALPGESVRAAQAMSDAAVIGVAHERQQRYVDQLQSALTSRIAIEQAKGMLAERFEWTMEEAFELLRSYARSHNTRLNDLVRSVIDGPPTEGPFRRTSPR